MRTISWSGTAAALMVAFGILLDGKTVSTDQNSAYQLPAPGTYSLGRIKPAADGDVLTEEGEATSLHCLFDDRIVLLSFIYTQCSDVYGCPLATAILAQVRKRLKANPELHDRVRLITLSFDPLHDTPEVMRVYGENFSAADDWFFVTTASLEKLEPILQAYQQPVRRDYQASGKPLGTFLHLLRVYLIDPSKSIRNIYSASFLDPELLASDVKTLALEDQAKSTMQPPGDTASPDETYRPRDEYSGYESGTFKSSSRALREHKGRPADLVAYVRKPPLGLPAVPVPKDNSLTLEKVELGRKLFFDRRLSFNNTISCAMCHIPEQGFTNNELATPVGFEGRFVRRNAPTLYNVAYMKHLFHDARETSLEVQVWTPLLNPAEMACPSVEWLVDKIRGLSDYKGLFERAFGRTVSMDLIGKAIASYERALVSGNSAFDRWYFGRQQDALGEEAKHGFRLFIGKARCGACHSIEGDYALFTDNRLHSTGLGWHKSMHKSPEKSRILLAPGVHVEVDKAIIDALSEGVANDLGRYEITQDPADLWTYRTPTLRNIALTAPYMHDGSLNTLEEVGAFYNRGGYQSPVTDPLIKPLHLTEDERKALIAFLRSLTGDNVETLMNDAFAAPIGDPGFGYSTAQ